MGIPTLRRFGNQTLYEDDWEASVMEDLEASHGVRVYTPRDAIQAEPLDEEPRYAEDDYAMTLGEIGLVLGLSVERVRQIQEQALAKLRRSGLWDDVHGEGPTYRRRRAR